MSQADFWSAVATNFTTQNLLTAFNGFAPIVLTTVIVGLCLYLYRRISKRLARGKGGF